MHIGGGGVEERGGQGGGEEESSEAGTPLLDRWRLLESSVGEEMQNTPFGTRLEDSGNGQKEEDRDWDRIGSEKRSPNGRSTTAMALCVAPDVFSREYSSEY